MAIKDKFSPVALPKTLSTLALAFLLSACGGDDSGGDQTGSGGNGGDQPTDNIQTFAIMPDVHFHDVYGEMLDNSDDYGIPIETNEGMQNAKLRTMQAQLTSTRLFNENYFAFQAALADIRARNIKNVILPGDFSDDGQPIHIRGLKKIMQHYQQEYGIQFYMANGNHDPGRPFDQAAGKSDFLAASGKKQPIHSRDHKACQSEQPVTGDAESEAQICSDDLKEYGYESLNQVLGEFGFYPQANYLYWATPFSTYQASDYTFASAQAESAIENRLFTICHEGSYTTTPIADYTNCYPTPDMTYVVEPVNGVWLLMIDGNVFVPKATTDGDAQNASNYGSASSAGYNKLMTHKRHTIDFIRRVAADAKTNNKVLIASSHYPMGDFYDGVADKIALLWGKGNFQLERMPEAEVTKALVDAGIRVHFGGHMHFNDTYLGRFDENYFLNVQTPSMAAYAPAYKTLSIDTEKQILTIETILLNEVARFDELFPLYQTEHQHLTDLGKTGIDIWNKGILESIDYYEFTDWHMRELSRLRFIPEDWAESGMSASLDSMNGFELLATALLNTTVSYEQLGYSAETLTQTDAPIVGKNPQWLIEHATNLAGQQQLQNDWQTAQDQALILLQNQGVNLGYEQTDWQAWNGNDLSVDFYRLRNADQLALHDISAARIAMYSLLGKTLKATNTELPTAEVDAKSILVGAAFQAKFKILFEIMAAFSQDTSSENFQFDLPTGQLTNLSETHPAIEIE